MRKVFKNSVIFARLIYESLVFAFTSIVANKLRTFLSLLGVTIGIFSIISMFTVIDALRSNVNNTLSEIGSDVIYVGPFPWVPEESGEYKWWKYMQRPRNKFAEYNYLMKSADAVGVGGMGVGFTRKLQYKSNVASNSWGYGMTHDMNQVMDINIEEGRYFSVFESQNGGNAIILGGVVAKELFNDEAPLGKYVKLGGRKMLVIGILKVKGESMVNVNNFDNGVIIPFNTAKHMVNINNTSPEAAYKAKAGYDVKQLEEDVRRHLRAYRRLKPIQEDNFAINKLSLLEKMTEQIFGVINIAGWVIGFFSLLVGCFGIANIMFVSVRERTNIIGVQKALGAKNYFILTQFLSEAVILSLTGGIAGLVLIFLGAGLVNALTSFTINLTVYNISLGLIISCIIGILSGFIPAFIASRLNPVVAINFK